MFQSLVFTIFRRICFKTFIQFISEFDRFEYSWCDPVWQVVFILIKFCTFLWKIFIIHFGDDFFESRIIHVRISRDWHLVATRYPLQKVLLESHLSLCGRISMDVFTTDQAIINLFLSITPCMKCGVSIICPGTIIKFIGGISILSATVTPKIWGIASILWQMWVVPSITRVPALTSKMKTQPA